MMKKFILIFFSIICVFLMAACSDERIEKQDSSVPVQEVITESPSINQIIMKQRKLQLGNRMRMQDLN